MILIVLAVLVAVVHGYKSGAPIVACDSMAPGHNVEAQVSIL
jgi:hypothetical protein